MNRHEQGARLLLALDELANVAPLPRLASIVSEGGGQGVVTLACLQDLSQARSRWGTSAEGFLSLFPTTVVLARYRRSPHARDVCAASPDARSIQRRLSSSDREASVPAARPVGWSANRASMSETRPRSSRLRHGSGREQTDEVDRTDPGSRTPALSGLPGARARLVA